MSKIKALVLDAGGVLVHPIHGNWNIPVKYRELLGDYARDIPGEAWLQACRAEAAYLREDIYISGMDEEYNLRLKFLTAVAGRMGWQLADETLRELTHDFTYNPDRYAWYDDVLPWLAKWRSEMHVGILSDAMPSFPLVVKAHRAYQYIEALVISTEVGCAKPNAKMYETIIDQLQVKPGECLFVDDRECNLQGAMQAGMRAVQMCRDGMVGWDGDKVRDLAELNHYMEGLT